MPAILQQFLHGFVKIDDARLVEPKRYLSLCAASQTFLDLEAGGIYLNNVRETNAARAITTGDLLFGRHLLLRKGKRNYVVVTAR